MSILIVGNVVKDVYLNLDPRTETFETDSNNTKWLDLSFNASEHHFFSRTSSFGGAAISFEVLQKFGLPCQVSNANLHFTPDGLSLDSLAATYRYILTADGQVSYFSPTRQPSTQFTAPNDSYDYLYVDRSAHLTTATVQQITTYLDNSPHTKLVLYSRDPNDSVIEPLSSRANLIFTELPPHTSEETQALASIDPHHTNSVLISHDHITYQDISVPFSLDRIDMITHLSTYSVLAATTLACFVLGHSVEDSLKMACLNVENATLNSTLSLSELQNLSLTVNPGDNLELLAANLVLPPKGILAADESGGSIKKKFAQLDIPDTYENRRDYRNLFFTTPGLEDFVNGVILFDETTHQTADNGQNFVDFLTAKRIIPGIKVDQGLAPFDDSLETYTKGLDDLPERLQTYYAAGLRFAKWRAAFELRLSDSGNILTPTDHAITENCRILAQYAKACQSAGLVPIVEPEVVYDGYYSLENNLSVTSHILDTLFAQLAEHQVNLRACILKVNMILASKNYPTQSTPTEIGKATADVLKNHVPAELAGVVFLSGGQTVEQATDNLAAVIQNGPFPWPVTFSFARALQDPALYTWAGDNSHADAARTAFRDRLVANTDALKTA